MIPELIHAFFESDDFLKLLCAAIASAVTYFLKRIYDGRNLLPIRSEQAGALNGVWVGKIHQAAGALKGDGELTCTFVVKGKAITGSGILRAVDVRDVLHIMNLQFKGGFYKDSFLKLDYRNIKKNEKIQFGDIVLRINAEANALEGAYCGYGSVAENIVTGTIKLEKGT